MKSKKCQLINIAIGLVARFAYELSGDRKMSTPIWETNENSFNPESFHV